LGLSEEDFLKRAKSISQEVAALERIKRKEMYLDHLIELEDMARRSYGILRNARIITFEETMLHLSHMKLGIDLSVLKPMRNFDLYDAVIHMGKAHLQMERESFLDDRSSNIYRANKVRQFIKEVF
ncbi:MAG: ATP--guanido phosphotransferase, partial [Aedoeadaptatus pacaensis]